MSDTASMDDYINIDTRELGIRLNNSREELRDRAMWVLNAIHEDYYLIENVQVDIYASPKSMVRVKLLDRDGSVREMKLTLELFDHVRQMRGK